MVRSRTLERPIHLRSARMLDVGAGALVDPGSRLTGASGCFVLNGRQAYRRDEASA